MVPTCEGCTDLHGLTPPTESTETASVPFRAPTAKMSGNARPAPRDLAVSHAPTNTASGQDQLTSGQEYDHVAAAAAEKANNKRDRADGDFTPTKRRREAPPTPSSSRSPQVRKKNQSSDKPPAPKSNAGKPYDKCTGLTQAQRRRHIDGIQKFWGYDHSQWPTYSTCPAKMPNVRLVGSSDRDALPPRDWGNPLLEEVENLARSTKDQFTHEEVRRALERAVDERVAPFGGRSLLIPADVASVVRKFQGNSRVEEPEHTSRSPTLAPQQPRANSAGQNQGGNAGQYQGDNAGQHQGDNAGQHQGDNAGQNQGDNAGQHQGDNAGQHQGGNAGRQARNESPTSTSRDHAAPMPAEVKQENASAGGILNYTGWNAAMLEDISNKCKSLADLQRQMEQLSSQLPLSVQRLCQGDARNPIVVS